MSENTQRDDRNPPDAWRYWEKQTIEGEVKWIKDKSDHDQLVKDLLELEERGTGRMYTVWRNSGAMNKEWKRTRPREGDRIKIEFLSDQEEFDMTILNEDWEEKSDSDSQRIDW